MTLTPTAEQQVALDLFSTGVGLAIQAGAGTGKTTTLELLAGSTRRRGTYAAFNRAIVDEARRKMPSNVSSSTAHGLAMKQTGRRYAHRLKAGRMRSDKVAKLLGVEYMVVDKYDGERKVMQPGHLASLVQRAVMNFCFSADEAPSIDHVPWVEGIDPPDRSSREANRAVRHHLGPAIARAWADLSAVDGELRFSHDHYLKLWQLGDPKIPGDFVLFDEAQDAAPVMLAAVQAQHHAQLVFVGDSQQQIYEWRGAVDALDSVGTEAVAYLSESFRFGQPIATLANVVLLILGSPLRLTGRGGPSQVVDVDVADPDAILTRTNAEAVTQVLSFQREGRNPYLVGGGAEVLSFAKAAVDLKAGQPTWHPELQCFDTWGEVQAYVEDDPSGGELKLLVSLVDDFGVDIIIEALDRMPDEANADVVVSTAHKAKGREWDHVRLGGDFQVPDEDAAGEWRLLYVAATRARKVLDVGGCEPLRDLVPRTTAQDRIAAAFG